MNYEEMSDFEINSAVSKLVKFEGLTLLVDEYKEEVTIVEVFDWGVKLVGKFDPCNNPNDAFPIIVESGISLVWMDAKVSYYEAHGINEEIWDEDWHSQHTNALRAAMICFLKMKDAEK